MSNDLLIGIIISLALFIIANIQTRRMINDKIKCQSFKKDKYITIDNIDDNKSCYNVIDYGCKEKDGIYYKLPDGKCINAITTEPIKGKPGEFEYKIYYPSNLVNVCDENVIYPTEGRYVRLLFTPPVAIKKFYAVNKKKNNYPLTTHSVFTNFPLLYSDGYLDVLKDHENEKEVYIPHPAEYIQLDVIQEDKNDIITDIVIELADREDHVRHLKTMILQILYDPYIRGSLGPPLPVPKDDEDWNSIVIYEKKLNSLDLY